MNDELNKKLAKWAEFRFEPLKPKLEFQGQVCGVWRIPNTEGKPTFYQTTVELPNFPKSLDACFEWLVPKLSHYFIGDSVHGHTATVWNQSYSYGANGDTPALALCLAIEKLIDSRED